MKDPDAHGSLCAGEQCEKSIRNFEVQFYGVYNVAHNVAHIVRGAALGLFRASYVSDFAGLLTFFLK